MPVIFRPTRGGKQGPYLAQSAQNGSKISHPTNDPIFTLFLGFYTADIYKYIYRNVADLLDLLSLINCNVDFILYCFMSSRYRQTFSTLIIRTSKWLSNRRKRKAVEKEWKRSNNASSIADYDKPSYVQMQILPTPTSDHEKSDVPKVVV
jgi:hypothetical protein